jgi:cytochrome-b5 reductase
MKDEKTELILLFANKTEEDIVLKKEIDDLKERVTVKYILDHAPPNWKEYSGYITH